MSFDDFSSVRYRTLVVTIWMAAVLSAAAAAIAWRMPGSGWVGSAIFLGVAVFVLAMLPLAAAARRRNDRRGIERVATAVLVIGGLAMLQRITYHAWITWAEIPDANPFRPVLQFLPFFYIACIALLRARRALPVCWAGWALVVAITGAGAWRAGLSVQNEGVLTLSVWLLIANPLFISLLHALPRYEEALDRSAAEMREIRVRNELLEKLAVSEQRFNMVVDGLQVGVWDRVIAEDGSERRWWSARFYELIGYTPEAMPPSEESLKSLMHPDERGTVWEEGTGQLLRGDIMDVNFRLNTRHRGYRWFNSHGKAERDASGRLLRIAGAIADIHDRKMAEQALLETKHELTRLAYRDTLTDLHNRRAFDEQFLREWERARRYGRPLSLVLMDLDYFKPYNDRYGHSAGDRCLVELARLVQVCLHRPADLVARMGGEEFAILLPETHMAGSIEVAQRINSTIRSAAIPHETSPKGVVTTSVGVATASSDAPWPATHAVMFEQADQALYRVKRRGRDSVLHYTTMGESDTGNFNVTAA